MPVSTRNEAIQAASLLQRYKKGLDDPFTHKLDGMLGAFGQRMQLLH
jgi:hypothetical protein